jgi:hypothetical protein
MVAGFPLVQRGRCVAALGVPRLPSPWGPLPRTHSKPPPTALRAVFNRVRVEERQSRVGRWISVAVTSEGS